MSKLNHAPDRSSVFTRGGFSKYQGSGSGTHSTFSAQTWLDASVLGSAAFQNALDSRQQAELSALARERNPDLFFSSLLVFANHLEEIKKPEFAASIYGAVSEGAANQGLAAIADTARQRGLALRGEGGFGGQAEAMIRGFKDSATDYRTIVPMLAGSIVGQIAKTATITRLLGVGEAGALGRAFGAKALGGAVGFGAESLAFAGLGRALNQAPTRSFGQDLASSVISLGALKLSGGIAEKAGFQSGIGRYGSLYLGMLAAHTLEAELQLRPKSNGWMMASEALAGMLSMEVGAHLGNRALGPKWAAFQQELGARLLASQERASGSASLLPPHAMPLPASGPRAPIFLSEMNRPKVPSVMMMSELKPGETNLAGTSGVAPDAAYPYTHRSEDEMVGVRLVTELVSANPIPNMGALAARLKQSLMDILWEGKEGFIKLKGPIAERLRQSEELRAELVGNYSQSEVRIDVSSGRIVSLRFFDGERVVKTITEESLGKPAEAAPKPAEVPAPANSEPLQPAIADAAPVRAVPDPADHKVLVGSPNGEKPELRIPAEFSPLGPSWKKYHRLKMVFDVVQASEKMLDTYTISQIIKKRYDEDIHGGIVHQYLLLMQRAARSQAVAQAATPPVAAPAAELVPPAAPATTAPIPISNEIPAPQPIVETQKDRAQRIGPHQLAPLQARVFEIFSGLPGEELVFGEIRKLYDGKFSSHWAGDSGIRGSLDRLVEKKLIELRVSEKRGATGSNYFYKLIPQAELPVASVNAEAPSPASTATEPVTTGPATPDASRQPRPIQIDPLKRKPANLPEEMHAYTTKQFVMHILELAGREMTPHEIKIDLKTRYQLTVTRNTVTTRLRELESEGMLESRPHIARGAPTNQFWIKKKDGDATSAVSEQVPIEPPTPDAPHAREPGQIDRPESQSKTMPPWMHQYTAKQFALHILEVSGSEMTPQEVVDDLQARYQVALSIITVRARLRELEAEGKLESRPLDAIRGGVPAKKYWIKKPGGGDGGDQGGSTPAGSGEPGPAVPPAASPVAPTSAAAMDSAAPMEAPAIAALDFNEPKVEETAAEERVIDLNQGWRDLQHGLRLFGIPQANQDRIPSYQINVLFPGLMHLIFGANIHPDGNMVLRETPAPKLSDFSARSPGRVQVEKVSGFRGRVSVALDRDPKPITLDLSPVLGTTGSILRIGAAPNQNVVSAAWQAWFGASPASRRQRVRYLHHEQITNVLKFKGDGDRFQKYWMYLSNGDALEFEVRVRHHGSGDMEVQYANLHRFGAPAEETTELKFSTSRKNRDVRVELKNDAYRIQFKFSIPQPDQSESQIRDVQVLQHPAPVFLKLAESKESTAPDTDRKIFDLENQALGGSREALEALGELALTDARAIQALKDLSDIVTDTGEATIGELEQKEFLELLNRLQERAISEGPSSGPDSKPASMPIPPGPKSGLGAGGPSSGNSERIRRWVDQSKNRNWRELIRGSVLNNINRTKSDLSAAEAQDLLLEFSAAFQKNQGNQKDLRYSLGLYQALEALKPLVDAATAATVDARLKSQAALVDQLNQIWNRTRTSEGSIPPARASRPGPLLPRVEKESPEISTVKTLVEFAARAETEARRIQYRRQLEESLQKLSSQERHRLAEEILPQVSYLFGEPDKHEKDARLLLDVLASLVHGFDPSQRQPLIEKIPPLWRDKVKERFPN